MADLRKYMDSDTLNMILFLKASKNLWVIKKYHRWDYLNFAAEGEPLDDWAVAPGASDVNF